MGAVSAETGNLFDAIPDALSEELFEELAKGQGVRIERIVSKGHTSPDEGWYDQDQHEWVVVIQGEAKLAFSQGGELHLQAGSFINIPAHTKHRVAWTSAEIETIWLAVHYG
ncbi:MAG: cupin domain-containing protein [Pseudomonadota bacterium]